MFTPQVDKIRETLFRVLLEIFLGDGKAYAEQKRILKI
jgi:hypothetical protein